MTAYRVALPCAVRPHRAVVFLVSCRHDMTRVNRSGSFVYHIRAAGGEMDI